MSSSVLPTLLVLQLIVLAAHDTAPLGRWNNLSHFKTTAPLRRRVIGTLVNTATGGLALLFYYLARRHGPTEPLTGVIVVQGLLFFGELRAWWWPWFFGAKPEVVAHLRPNWEGTFSFFPERHGLRINALHSLLHFLTLAALLVALFSKHGHPF